MAVQPVVWFSEITRNDNGIAGGKGVNLGIMYNLKLAVPPGFVITAQAYKYFTEITNIQSEILNVLKGLDVEDTTKLQSASEKIQEIILDAKMPDAIKSAIIEAYDDMNVDRAVSKVVGKDVINTFIKAGRDAPFVAVRSSATAEDQPSISEDEYVLVRLNGKPFFGKMKELVNIVGYSDEILVPAMDNFKVEWKKVSDIYKHKVDSKFLYKITTATGKQITISPNHSLIVLDETTLQPKVTEVAGLNGNEKIPVIKNIPLIDSIKEVKILDYINNGGVVEYKNTLMIKNKSNNWKIQKGLPKEIRITKDFAYFLGIYAAEGTTYKKNEIIITNSNAQIISRIRTFITSLGLNSDVKINKYSLRFYCKTLVRFLNENCGVPDHKIKGKGKTCRTKEVPSFIFATPKEIIGEYLKGYFDGDGTVDKMVNCSSTSQKLIAGISTLLELLNIEFYILNKKKSRENWHDKWIINLPLKALEKYKNFIGFFHEDKAKKLNQLLNNYNLIEKHMQFKNSFTISKEFACQVREFIDSNLPKQKVIIALCPQCSHNINKSSKYKDLERFYCSDCKKVFYENQVIKTTIEKYINYDFKGRFLKSSVPWNKSINTYPVYGESKFRQILSKNGLVQLAEPLFTDSIIWDKILKVEEVNYDSYVYDFTIPGVENFAAGFGGIITHNSASFAGQQATYLNVRGKDDLVLAVQKCWASLFTARAIYYRTKNNFPHDKVLIAVVVQKMVNSEKSGVMFSVNPATNNENEIMIEAAFGLGEVVVGGEITPDTYIVDKATLQIKSRKVAKQEYGIFRDQYTGKNIKRKLNENEASKQKLFDDEILTLAKYAKTLEDHYGKPMDSEWAIENGKIYLVQTRPVTTLLRKRAEALKIEAIDMKEVVRGLGASPGVGVGKVKIIKDLTELNKIEKGDVLITRMTSPDMVAAMKKAVAIATDEGGVTCFKGNTKILTDKGVFGFENLSSMYCAGEEFRVASLDPITDTTVWRKVNGIIRKKDKVSKLQISPTLRSTQNFIEVTLSHKFLTLENRKLIKKSVKDIIDSSEGVIICDKLSSLDNSFENRKKAYFMGAIFSDGHFEKNKRGGYSVQFSQDLIETKISFINKVNSCLNEVYDKSFSTYLSGRSDELTLRCSRKEVYSEVMMFKQKIFSFVLNADEISLYNFLAGFIDGDGSSGDHQVFITVGEAKKLYLEAIVYAALRLGIHYHMIKQNNYYIFNFTENTEKLLQFCNRVNKSHIKKFGNKSFLAKQIIGDIIDEVNYRGKIKHAYIVRNNLVSDKKLSKLIPKCNPFAGEELDKLLNSHIRMYRIKEEETNNFEEFVYDLWVDSDDELGHNYIVFTSMYTPLVVSNCHAAIVSRELGIPCIVGTEKITQLVKDGDLITVDGTRGVVYLGNASSALTSNEQGETLQNVSVNQEVVSSLKEGGEIITGTKIYMNLGEPEKIDDYKSLPFDGIGLMRIEFIVTDSVGKHPLFLIKNSRQQEYIDKLVEGISKVAGTISPKPIIVRFSDFKTNEYKNLEGGAEFEQHEENPMIGWRGVSRYISPDFIEAFKLELKAIKKCRDQGLGNVHVMLPFVRNTDEVLKCLEIMKSEGLVRSSDFGIYLMAEVPAIALMAEEFAELPITGASIGSNDLTQGILCVDRDSTKLGRMGYFDERNPAVLKGISNIIKGFRKHGKSISICGQAPSEYPEFVEFLIKEGITSISVNPDVVLQVRKQVASIERNILLGKIRGN